MNKIFHLIILPAVLLMSFATFAEDRGGDRVNNGISDKGKKELGAGLIDQELTKKEDEICAKDDKVCLKKQAAKKKAAEKEASKAPKAE